MDEKDELLDLAERAGLENLKGRLATGDTMLTQANGLLSLLLGGVGGAMAIGRTAFDAGTAPSHVWGAAAVAGYWSAVAIVLLVRCIMTRETQVLYNEPDNLYRPDSGWSLMQVRRADLALLQRRITLTKQRNKEVSWWLDRCRLAAVLAPVLFAIVGMAVEAGR